MAALAGVSRSAVSNWETRSGTFPERDTGRDGRASKKRPRFDAVAMIRWLLSDDSPADAEVVRKATGPLWWWGKCAEAVRQSNRGLTVDEARPYLAALVLLVAVSAGRVAGIPADEKLRRELRRSPGAAGVIRAASDLEKEERRLAELLVGPLAAFDLSDDALNELVLVLDDTLDASVPAGDVLDAALGDRTQEAARGARTATTTTAPDLARLMAELGAPEAPCTIYDPACGEGGLLAACVRRVRGRSDGEVSVVAQEFDPDALRGARTRLLLEGVDARFGEPLMDSISQDQFEDLSADLVVVDTPVASGTGARRGDEFGHGPEDWFQHVRGHVAAHGRVVVVLPGNAITVVWSARRRAHGDLIDLIRPLVADGRVESVVVLPRRFRPDISGPVTIWTIDAEPRSDVPLLIARPERVRMPTRRRESQDLPFEIDDIVALIETWRREPYDELAVSGHVRAEPFSRTVAWDAIVRAIVLLEEKGGRPELRKPKPELSGAPAPPRHAGGGSPAGLLDEIIDALGDEVARLSNDDPERYELIRRKVAELRGELE